MPAINLLPVLIFIIKKVFGKNTASRLLKLLSKNESFYHVNSIYDFDEKKSVKHLVLLLPGKGCAWAQKTGGCTMCGFSQKIRQIGKNFTAQDLIALYKITEIMTEEDKPYTLSIYNAGSFINNEEIPLEVQKIICQRIKQHPTIKKLVIESRAEFVTDDKIKFLKKGLGEKLLIISIGLETQNDKIRNIYIKKGLSKETYENALKIIKQNGARSLTYIFIKPIYLNEREAIDEAINTAKYAFGAGSNEVAFESAFIQEGTVMEQFYRRGEFRPPWLWSIIEVIKGTCNLGDVRLGGFEDEPPPIAIPSNCSKCSEKIEEMMQKYREINDIKLFDNLDCECKKEWQKSVKL
ncbi:MAG: archaeosine biosynthesis radical SAM protein RaSEA [Patescibacteria group bacterium]